MTHDPPASTAAALAPLAGARRRARLRRTSGGAAIFIVAVTLGVLAAMGVYALSATTNEIKAAGHLREGMHGQRTAEFAVMAAAETLTPAVAGALIAKSRSYDSANGRDVDCRSSKKATTDQKYRDAEACIRLTEEQMKTIAAQINPMVAPATALCANCPFFWGGPTGSFGPSANKPFLRVEITNPIDVPPPPGMGLDGSWTFTQVTATVYVEMKTAQNVPADTMVVARGRLTAGPYAR